MKPSAMIGIRCHHVDGLYVHPGGTSGPDMGMPCGIKIENVMRSAPTNRSLRYAAGLGTQKISGANKSQRPMKQLAHDAHGLAFAYPHAAHMSTSRPLMISLQIIPLLR